MNLLSIKQTINRHTRTPRQKTCLGAVLLFCIVCQVAYWAELETFNKSKFVIYTEINYSQAYQKLYGRLPVSLQGYEETLNKSGIDKTSSYPALALFTYKKYHPVLENIRVSPDGRSVVAVVHFEGFWFRQTTISFQKR